MLDRVSGFFDALESFLGAVEEIGRFLWAFAKMSLYIYCAYLLFRFTSAMLSIFLGSFNLE